MEHLFTKYILSATTSATALTTSSVTKPQIALFQVLKVLLVKNNWKEHLSHCANSTSHLLQKCFDVSFHNLAAIFHFPHHT